MKPNSGCFMIILWILVIAVAIIITVALYSSGVVK
jgi:hypothetical protein